VEVVTEEGTFVILFCEVGGICVEVDGILLEVSEVGFVGFGLGFEFGFVIASNFAMVSSKLSIAIARRFLYFLHII
jgi:hypothetical protein